MIKEVIMKAKNLNYIYSQGTAFEYYAIKSVSFEIKDEEFIGIIGHTGSGKSTLIQHMNGLIKATSGEILFHGIDIYSEGYDMKKLRQKVGLVFQYPEHQLFEIDVLADVCFGPKNQGLNDEEAKERAYYALSVVGLPESFYKKTYRQNQILGRALLESVVFFHGKCIYSAVSRKIMDFYGVNGADLEGIVSQLRNTEGIEMAVFMYELEPHVYKVSMRSLKEVDVSQIAMQFGGGGHKRAAGFTMAGSPHDIVNNISSRLVSILKIED